jgi:hypothetical protein
MPDPINQANIPAGAVGTNNNTVVLPVTAFTTGVASYPANDGPIWDVIDGNDPASAIRRRASRQLDERPQPWPETVGPRPVAAPGPAWGIEMTRVWYAIDIRVTKTKRQEDPGIVASLPYAIGYGVGEHQRRLRGLTYAAAQTQTLPDTKIVWSATHTTRDGTSRNNLLTTAPDRTALFAVRTKQRRWMNYRGDLADRSLMPKYLVHATELFEDVNIALGAQQAGSTGNDNQRTLMDMLGYVGTIDYPELPADVWGVECLSPMEGSRPFVHWQRAAQEYDQRENDDGSVSITVDFAEAYGIGPDPDNTFGRISAL